MADLWRGFWKHETGTGQQVAQLHDRYMIMVIMMMMMMQLTARKLSHVFSNPRIMTFHRLAGNTCTSIQTNKHTKHLLPKTTSCKWTASTCLLWVCQFESANMSSAPLRKKEHVIARDCKVAQSWGKCELFADKSQRSCSITTNC